MALVTYTFYTDTYYGEAIAEADFPRYDARAEDLILGLIKKTEEEAGALPASVLLAVQKAICSQIEYFLEYGLSLAVFGKEAGGGFTVGRVSVHEGSSSAGAATGARSMIAPAVYVYLEQTGLLNQAVPVQGMPAQYWGWIV